MKPDDMTVNIYEEIAQQKIQADRREQHYLNLVQWRRLVTLGVSL